MKKNITALTMLFSLALAHSDSLSFTDKWKDSTQSDGAGGLLVVSQDTGTLNASLTVPGLGSLSQSDFLALNFTLDFGDISFSDALADADTTTANSATFVQYSFDDNDNAFKAGTITFTRSGNVATVAVSLQNVLTTYPYPIIADQYLGLVGTIQDQQSVEISLDGAISYDAQRTITITGTGAETQDTQGDYLDTVQVSGSADFTAPTLTAVSPAVSGTVTNGLLNVQVKATDNVGVANVELYWDGWDYGSGFFDGTNKWSFGFPLSPGANLIQTVATDVNGNISATNSLTMTYVNRQTNANLITFSERWTDYSTGDTNGNLSVTGLEIGIVNAALLVPGLQAMSADTWSNLDLSIEFGALNFTGNLGDAEVLTTTNAVLYNNGGDEIIVSRSGNTLILVLPNYGSPDFARAYHGTAGAITDSAPFTMSLSDATTTYIEISRDVFITGTNSITSDGSGNELDNIQIAGTADMTPPTLTPVSPANGAKLTNGLVTVQMKATDNVGVNYVEFYLNGQDFGSGVPGNSNLWTMSFALPVGSNVVQVLATDYSGNVSATNTIQLTYINQQTNANVITLAEHRLNASYFGAPLAQVESDQDTGLLDAALQVPGLQNMPADTWSNLSLTLSFGGFSFIETFSTASVVTTNQAVFNYTDQSGDPAYIAQLAVSRSGNTLIIATRIGNPAFLVPGTFVAGNYLGLNGPVRDQQPLTLSVVDGSTADAYVNIARDIYFTGTDASTQNSQGATFDTVQIAGAADFTAPTNRIVAPVSGQWWSNSVFTVTGTARDNIGVAAVFYSLNNLDWTPANSGNGWTNWTAAVPLAPGTNTIQSYAVDLSGNASPTNTAAVVYVVSAPLQIQITGLGTVSPNYNNQLLPIGQNYSITSSPAAGFAFNNWVISTNWIGGSIITRTNLTFMMASNLTLQASFTDITRPSNNITAPIANQLWSNAQFTVTGSARDNWAVSNVLYSLNGSAWSNAISANQWTNWTAQVTLTPGTNNLKAFAVDTTGNHSLTNPVSFVYIVSGQLQLRTLGLGTFTPNYSNAWLQIGRNYSITSAPASGFTFTGWSLSTNWLGGTLVTNKNLAFTMASNLTLLAKFTDTNRPTLTISNPTNNQRMTNAVATVMGTASDNWKVAGVWYQLNNSAWSLATTTNGYTNWTQTVPLFAGTNTLKAYALDLGGNYSLTNSVSFVSSNSFKLQLSFGTTNPLLSDGLMLTLQLSSNLAGHLEYSTNLINWQSWTNFKGTSSAITFRDAAATNSAKRFYRAVVP